MFDKARTRSAATVVAAALIALPVASGGVTSAAPTGPSSLAQLSGSLGSGSLGSASASSDPADGYDVLFVRHGHTTYPQPEEELSPLGIEQAAALADELSDDPIDSVYTSLMVRAFQTGDDIAEDHDLPVLADEDLNEVGFEAPADIPPSELNAYYSNIVRQWINGQDRDTDFGGEGYRAIEARWNSWWQDFRQAHRYQHGTAVVVAHGALYGVMLPATCTNAITADFALSNPLDNTGIVKARLHPDGTLTCTEWNGVPVPSAS